MNETFKGIPGIKYEGLQPTNPLAYEYYDAVEEACFVCVGLRDSSP